MPIAQTVVDWPSKAALGRLGGGGPGEAWVLQRASSKVFSALTNTSSLFNWPPRADVPMHMSKSCRLAAPICPCTAHSRRSGQTPGDYLVLSPLLPHTPCHQLFSQSWAKHISLSASALLLPLSLCRSLSAFSWPWEPSPRSSQGYVFINKKRALTHVHVSRPLGTSSALRHAHQSLSNFLGCFPVPSLPRPRARLHQTPPPTAQVPAHTTPAHPSAPLPLPPHSAIHNLSPCLWPASPSRLRGPHGWGRLSLLHPSPLGAMPAPQEHCALSSSTPSFSLAAPVLVPTQGHTWGFHGLLQAPWTHATAVLPCPVSSLGCYSCFLKTNHTILWVPKHPWDAYTSWMVPAMWQWLCSFLLFKIGPCVGLRQKEEAWTSTIYY